MDYKDVPGSNKTGYCAHDEEVFVPLIATDVGAIIGLVVCNTEQSAHRVASLIRIEYELLASGIFSIDDAIAKNSYFDDEQCLEHGEINKGLTETEYILDGTLYIGGQEHFYIETNSYMVIPTRH